ncbi:MAG: hypothetical protein A2087_00405 [Spirochaetes bacterium GWD1_61_31]|nr:MAG: hypothetical protein A2Y37_00370 [Spirochaetes bacterium GWB1_60_80]OHD28923.1 MAG: hypothetical protein A2004_10850 [Spirochaetes bacterium GWC1_61_12]OHD39111.1 MAG: hypothetical protein A2087_00405 [Spirochaetes bacterium GWD1_61_31]OHD43542.1 MAG: hypothetical protein A2Y35_04690 [Spirochaetes bacterium GWE1_60_18]OHD59009.1 MAG: hypothetical protein A2Y32_01885 [Spirochaetes bacterium GWF1_60_12]HAP44507.1 histidine kinase [Spirochaetaceae bacterium]
MDLKTRANGKSIRQEQQLIANATNVAALLDKLPYSTMVLDEHRQIIYANRRLIENVGQASLEGILGQRPGELFNCIHAKDTQWGCGTSQACTFCGAVQTVLAALTSRQETAGDCRLTLEIQGKLVSQDLRITAAPLELANQLFLVVTLADISAEKHKQRLERIFLHDLTNTASALMMLITLIKDKPTSDDQESIELLNRVSQAVLEEIQSYRDMLAAEQGTLSLKPVPLKARAMLEEVAAYSRFFANPSRSNTFIINSGSPEIGLVSDRILLRRVLLNLAKNALEASGPGEAINLAVRTEADAVLFSVHNAAVMPYEVQAQVFQRSYSTKGKSRGIGTYSVKLLVENYLGGKARFESSPDGGTTFFVRLPGQPA